MNILAIGAHYDDIELGCSGTLIKHTLNGDRVTVLVITDSSYRDPNGVLIRSRETAYQEGMKATKIIGAELICLNYQTLAVPFDEGLTRELNRFVNDLEIDTIYSHWTGDLHRDHQYTARNALMAGRHVPRFLMYRSNYYETGQPFNGSFFSDISSVFETKLAAIHAHESELKRVQYSWVDFIVKQNANAGQLIGVHYAECFEIVRYLI